MGDDKERRTPKGYVFDSFDHKKFDEVLNFKNAAMFFRTKEHERIGELLDKFNPDEHQEIGNLIKTFPATEHQEIRNVIVKFNSDEHKGIGDLLQHFHPNQHEKVQQLVSTFKENGPSLKESTLHEGKTFSSAKQKISLRKSMKQAKNRDEEKEEEAKDFVDAGDEDSDEIEKILLPNGVRLTFGEIIALAGDYYGIPDAPIANPLAPDHVDSGVAERFQNAYSTLAHTPYEGKYKEQLDKLLEMLSGDCKKTKKPGQCQHSDKEWDEATGGAWLAGLPVIRGYMLKLAQNNFDHFLPHGKTAYLAGHKYALQKAREAGRSKGDSRLKLLSEARAIDAFACHFLTDAFASGHIRTPRVHLSRKVTPRVIGDLLCKYMHDEDNKFGIRVTNARGDKWIAYGDGMLMDKRSKKNLTLVVEAVQNSVNQIKEAYQDANKKPDPSVVTDLIPFADAEEKNNTPLFEVKDDGIHRRADIHDLQDTNTVTNWWGSTTAVKLQFQKHHNSAIP